MAVVALAVTLLLATAIVTLRMRLRRRERAWQAFVQQWRPVLLAAMLDPDAGQALPKLRPADHLAFLRLWCYLHESVRGDAADRLNALAAQLRIDVVVNRLLHLGPRTDKLQAVLAAGLLRDPRCWDALLAIARSPDGLLAVNAARSMVRIDPLAAAPVLLPLVAEREDWDLSRVASFLADARQPFWLAMAKAIPELTGEPLARLLRLAEALRLQLPDATLARLLQPPQPASVVQAALALAEGPSLGDSVRVCLAHEDPGVRHAATVRMGRLAQPDDVLLLQFCLADPEWTVRHAAAQALVQLPFLDEEALRRLAPDHPHAADVLQHALAERESMA